jgi:DNA-binding PadR family transcriptional regulator
MARKPSSGLAGDPELLILSSLAAGPKHGYAIMLDVADFAETKLGPGTLYSAITRLVEQGWIAPLSAPGRQRPYRITPAGLTGFRQQIERLRAIAAVASRRLRTV